MYSFLSQQCNFLIASLLFQFIIHKWPKIIIIVTTSGARSTSMKVKKSNKCNKKENFLLNLIKPWTWESWRTCETSQPWRSVEDRETRKQVISIMHTATSINSKLLEAEVHLNTPVLTNKQPRVINANWMKKRTTWSQSS